ncbi:CotH kinase family protein [Amycolatopsis sp. NPDC023774]|uniref:CotH kinase family protein n=1 Tax=Amycolatopsis sp. NPDC023774 TaxID=3155015 RepID=UPI00340809B4
MIANLIGSRFLTLNNSVQDSAFVRQPLDYKLFELAGLPHSRCNFARVRAPGVFVNAEPIMPRYIECNFGNL